MKILILYPVIASGHLWECGSLQSTRLDSIAPSTPWHPSEFGWNSTMTALAAVATPMSAAYTPAPTPGPSGGSKTASTKDLSWSYRSTLTNVSMHGALTVPTSTASANSKGHGNSDQGYDIFGGKAASIDPNIAAIVVVLSGVLLVQ